LRSEFSDDEDLVMLKCLNSTEEADGTRKEYFLRVPPSMETCWEAVAWTFGMGKREYVPVAES
jgi:hypothetical protein